MASEMPERIWAWGNNKIAWWHDKPEYGATEYVRADLAVLASTHTRAMEALAEPSDEMIDEVAKAIHDTDNMADTVWPEHDKDNGYRGYGAWERICREPELYRAAARNALSAALASIAAAKGEKP